MRADIAASFQAAVVDTLTGKCRQALEATGLERLVIAGGVGANRALRASLADLGRRVGARVYYPRAGAVHRQRRDDRVRGLVPARGRRRRVAAADRREAALAARRARAAASANLIANQRKRTKVDKTLPTRSRVEAIIGFWEWERRIKQIVSIDLEIGTDARVPRPASTRSRPR